MNRVLRVELTEQERKDLDLYLMIGNYPFGQISHILRCAVRDFIKAEKAKVEVAQKEAQGGDQDRKGGRSKKAQTNTHRGSPR